MFCPPVYPEVSRVSGDLTDSRSCKRFDGWKLRRELLVDGYNLISPSSLQHELGDHDAICTDTMAPGIVPLVLVPIGDQEILDSRLKPFGRFHCCDIPERLYQGENGSANILADLRRGERKIELLDSSFASGELLKSGSSLEFVGRV